MRNVLTNILFIVYLSMPSSTNKIDLDDIIKCLSTVAETLKEDPKSAVRDLRRVGAEIDSKVPYRDGHNIRVTDYCLAIADALGFTANSKLTLEVAALLHDFGKIGIDEDILLKPRKLTEQEKREISMHVMRGYYMLAGFNELIEALRGVRTHHEFYDGSGYPEGLMHEEIPLMGRIIAVADAFDAMTSERPYRAAKTQEEAIAELQRCSGSQFDPIVVEIFVHYLEEKDKKKTQ